MTSTISRLGGNPVSSTCCEVPQAQPEDVPAHDCPLHHAPEFELFFSTQSAGQRAPGELWFDRGLGDQQPSERPSATPRVVA
ncbi:MAG TPA: hypothetical protein VKR21_01520 [Solirubrobacteraceae bacterium]|nr:hypothetical protein [Solirubrobacteraceae bacterium]